MKIIGVIYCHEADQECLKPFIECFSRVNPDIELFILSDIDSPVASEFIPEGISVRPGHWIKDGSPISSGVRNDLISLVAETAADWVLKLDADCIHLNNRWRNGIGEAGIHAVGLAHGFLQSAFLGACYALSAHALNSICYVAETNVTAEDMGMSKLIWDATGKESIKLHRNLIYGLGSADIDPERYRAGDIIHCGEINQGKPDARIKCAEKMRELCTYFAK